MIEVEAKVKILDLRSERRKVRNLARLISKEIKLDDYYTLEDLKKYPKRSLRIRRKKNSYEINFKQKISYIAGVHAKKESEFKVSSPENFLGLIKDFGFKKWLRKEKHSEIYEIKKNFHIEINYVKKLGWFMEIEYLTKRDKIDEARKAIEKIIKILGVKKEQIVKEGYTKMLWDKKYLRSK